MIGGKPLLTELEVISQNHSDFKAVDVGCGTGFMSTYLGLEIQKHPHRLCSDTKVYGVDLSPVQPGARPPDNVEFIQGDIMELAGIDPRFQPDTFDFVTHRMLVLGIPDWDAYVRTCFRLLRPGGRIELQDNAMRWYDIRDDEISQNWAWLKVVRRATSKLGIDTLGPEKLKQFIIDAGFVDVTENVFKWHTTDQHWEDYPDSDRIGHYTVHTLRRNFPKFLRKVTQRAGLDETGDLEGLEGLGELEADYTRSMTGLPKGSHTNYFVFCGRKP